MPAPKQPRARTQTSKNAPSRRATAKEGAASVASTIADTLKQEAAKKLIEVTTSAIGDAAANVLPAFSRRRELWRARRAAEDYARKIEGLYTDVSIDGSGYDRHYVVWKDGQAVRAFPAVEGDVSALPDVQRVAVSQLRAPAELKRRRLRRS